MNKNLGLKARPAKEVADYIQYDDPYDLVISFGYALPVEAKELVRPVPVEGPLNPYDKPYHLSLEASHWYSNRDGRHVAFRAVDLDERLEHDFGRLPRIVHCEYGLQRSPLLVMFLQSTRLLRQNPDKEIGTVMTQVLQETLQGLGHERDWQAFDMPQRDQRELANNFQLMVPLQLKWYREQRLAVTAPIRPDAADGTPEPLRR